MNGANVKNLAIGVAIFAGVGVALYVLYKGKQGIDKVTKAVGDSVGYLTGTSQTSSLGSDIYDALHPATPANSPVNMDDPQVRKTCEALYPKGSGKQPKPGGVCALVLGPAWNADSRLATDAARLAAGVEPV